MPETSAKECRRGLGDLWGIEPLCDGADRHASEAEDVSRAPLSRKPSFLKG